MEEKGISRSGIGLYVRSAEIIQETKKPSSVEGVGDYISVI